MNKPTLSICIPTLNREHFLKECLDSIVCQFADREIYEQVEIVISDNASVDNTPEIVKEYQTRFDNIKYIRHEVIIPGSLNWNAASKISSGLYVHTIGDDDIYLPNSLKNILSILKKEPAGFVIVAYASIENNKIKFADDYSGKFIKILSEDLIRDSYDSQNKPLAKNMSTLPTFLFFKGDLVHDIINKTGYFWKEPLADHWAILNCLNRQEFIIFYDHPVVAYRIHPGAASVTKYNSKWMKERLEIFLKEHDKNFDILPGPSFTNLVYVAMQDTQFYYPEYKKYALNVDKLLISQINDLLHSDISLKDKIKYTFQSFCRLKEKQYLIKSGLITKIIKYLIKKVVH